MPEAPRKRPPHAAVLHSLRSHIQARPRAVFDAIAERFDPGEGAQSYFTADSAAGLVIVQGGWYRAEYRVIPDDHGSRVEHVILDIAKTQRRLGQGFKRRVIDSAPADFDRLIKSLRAGLE